MELCISKNQHKLFGSYFSLYTPCYVQAEEVWNFALEYAKFRITKSGRSGRDRLVEVTERDMQYLEVFHKIIWHFPFSYLKDDFFVKFA